MKNWWRIPYRPAVHQCWPEARIEQHEKQDFASKRLRLLGFFV